MELYQELFNDYLKEYYKTLEELLNCLENNDKEKFQEKVNIFVYKKDNESEYTKDKNYIERLKLVLSILYHKNRNELMNKKSFEDLLLFLFEEEIKDRQTNSYQGIGTSLEIMSFLFVKLYNDDINKLLSKYKDLFYKAKNANFDCNCGYGVDDYNYYNEFMKALAQQAQDPNSIYYSPTFSQQYNNYSQNQTHNNPYQEVMDAMSAASDNYNNQNNNGYYGNNQNTAVNPYEELMKMLEKESQNPNSPYYSPNASQNQNNNNNNNNNYNNQNYQNYNAPANSSQNPYELAAQELIKAAEESSRQAQNNNNNYNDPYNNYAQNGGYNDPNNYGAADNYNNTANNYGAADNYNNTQDNYGNANQQNNNFYTPFEVPQAVLDTAKRTYPNAEIWAIDMEYIDIYEIKMSNMMELYIDKTGKLLYQQFDD